MNESIYVMKNPMRGLSLLRKPRIGFAFDMYCWLWMTDYTQLSLNELDMLSPKEMVIKTMLSAHHSYCMARGEKRKLNEQSFWAIYKRLTQEDLELFISALNNSRIYGKKISDFTEQTEKKK